MDWYDGAPRMTITQAFAAAPKMPPTPESPKWLNDDAIYTHSDLGSIYALLSFDDRAMHVCTAGQCFVWNYGNQPHEDGFRLFSYRSPDGWGRVSIQTRTLETCIDGTGSRMYTGNWRKRAETYGARLLNGENLVLLDFAGSYSFGNWALEQSHIESMVADVERWWKGLPSVDVPAPTDEEKARKIEYR